MSLYCLCSDPQIPPELALFSVGVGDSAWGLCSGCGWVSWNSNVSILLVYIFSDNVNCHAVVNTILYKRIIMFFTNFQYDCGGNAGYG